MTRALKALAVAVVALPLSIAALGAKAQDKDIVATASSAGSFDKLVNAIEVAGLDEALKTEGPFTVFAPTDEAFAKLPEGELDDLLRPENKDDLVELLSYHVVAGKITAADLAGKMSSYETLAGSEVKIDSAGRVAKVNHAAILQPDVMASNGVIHAIDKVIVPN